uniref:Uncharacterized protein n=1 Tax=Rhizophora mucronata TaxID=61149 RepID=A0A2P2NSJ7_RHIMU
MENRYGCFLCYGSMRDKTRQKNFLIPGCPFTIKRRYVPLTMDLPFLQAIPPLPIRRRTLTCADEHDFWHSQCCSLE